MTTKLKKVANKVDPDLLTLLDQAREQVLAGKVLGLVVLSNNIANEYTYASAGDMHMSEVLNAFGSWEFDQRIREWQELNK